MDAAQSRRESPTDTDWIGVADRNEGAAGEVEDEGTAGAVSDMMGWLRKKEKWSPPASLKEIPISNPFFFYKRSITVQCDTVSLVSVPVIIIWEIFLIHFLT